MFSKIKSKFDEKKFEKEQEMLKSSFAYSHLKYEHDSYRGLKKGDSLSSVLEGFAPYTVEYYGEKMNESGNTDAIFLGLEVGKHAKDAICEKLGLNPDRETTVSMFRYALENGELSPEILNKMVNSNSAVNELARHGIAMGQIDSQGNVIEGSISVVGKDASMEEVAKTCEYLNSVYKASMQKEQDDSAQEDNSANLTE